MTDAKKLSREERRARMPEVSAVVNEFAAVFGAVTVEYAEEGGLVWGNKPPEVRAVKLSDMELWRAHERQKGAEQAVHRVGGAKPRAHVGDQAAVRSARARAHESAATRGESAALPGLGDRSKA